MNTITHTALTPLMRQYYAIKQKHPETLLLFQVGDFYELFFDDAIKASAFLGIALTQRGTTSDGEPIPLCGVPVHVLDTYISKLVKGGFKVAICDQLEAAHTAHNGKKIIERGITQVLTPGTLTDSALLQDKSASYLSAVFPEDQYTGLIFVELLTGQVFATLIPASKISSKLVEAEIARFMPDEIVVPDTKFGHLLESSLRPIGYTVSREVFTPHAYNTIENTQEWFGEQFIAHKHVWTEKADAFRYAFVVLHTYLKRNNERSLSQLKSLSIYNSDDFLMLDAATQRNLELIKNTQDGSAAHTLFTILDGAVTGMGSRALKKWLLRPLVKLEIIEQRLDAVSCLVTDVLFKEELQHLLRQIGDLERIVGRIALRRAQLQDYRVLMASLEILPKIACLLEQHESVTLIHIIKSRFADFSMLQHILTQALNADTTTQWLIKTGFNAELDRLRLLLEHGAQAIVALERKEQAATGINSLKIRYSGAHGYGIEITKTHMALVPAHYMRVQTLVNRERFSTQELKDLEYDLMRARSDSTEIEKELFEALKNQVEQFINPLKKTAQALAYIDALAGLAHIAYQRGYSRPVFNANRDCIIERGRHPVIEARLQSKFIANTTHLTDQESLWIITGPNMGGKSTYLRQVALISIMAQMGSFVSASHANLPLLDRIFTRIGAADNVAEGKSTFLVEMEETALICTQATANSLVILDEVGRGTSTFDGLAIAQAVVEYIYTHVKARCLFATHYHELTMLSQQYPGIASYYAASTKTAQGIVLLHKIVPGVADGSFGLEVAKLAQLPDMLISRARDILTVLTATEQEHQKAYAPAHLIEKNHQHTNSDQALTRLQASYQELMQRKQELEHYAAQLEVITSKDKQVLMQLTAIDCDSLTPRQAFDVLCKLKENL